MNIRLKYALFSIFGILFGVGGTVARFQSIAAAAQQEQKPCAQVYDQRNHLKNVDQELFDLRNKVIGDLAKRNQELETELKATRVARMRIQSAAELADRGPIGTGDLLDPTCRRFCGGAPIPPQYIISTVLVDGSGAVRFIISGIPEHIAIDGDFSGWHYFRFNNGFWTAGNHLEQIPH